jgi:endonuclease/exonuclease/phosphatase family metal-dependent hydrolase
VKELSQQGSGQDTLRQVYAPTNDADEETKDSFYDKLQSVIHLTPRHDITIVVGDLNAKVGTKLDGEDGIVGEHGLQSERNDNDERFSSLCANNNLAIVSTMFPHKKIHLHTWTSANGHHHNQIDHVAINGQYKRSINDVRAHRGADVGSDHNLVVIKTRLKLCKIGKKPSTSKRYETCQLKVPEIN